MTMLSNDIFKQCIDIHSVLRAHVSRIPEQWNWETVRVYHGAEENMQAYKHWTITLDVLQTQ
jgi:hypothetical protein